MTIKAELPEKVANKDKETGQKQNSLTQKKQVQ